MVAQRDFRLKLYDKLARIKDGAFLPNASRRVRRAGIRRDGEVLTFTQHCQSGERPWYRGDAGQLVRWLLDNGHVVEKGKRKW